MSLFMAWEDGARVCAMDPIELLSPVTYIELHGITVRFSVPSIAAALHHRGALKPNTMPTVRWSLFCGAALARDVAEAWQSAAAALRLGFTFEGVFRQAVVYKGRNRDTAWYSVLDTEWPSLRAAFESWSSPENRDSSGRQLRSLTTVRNDG